MRRVIRAMGCVLGLAVFVTVLGTGATARGAGLSITGGGIKQFGDPAYYYIFEVFMDPGYSFQLGDSFTLHELGGAHTPGSLTSSPNGPPDPSGPWTPIFKNEPDGPLPNYSPPTIVPFADVTFLNQLNVAGPYTSEKYLGEFRVLTLGSLPVLPLDYTTPINWTASIHDPNGNRVDDSGIVVLHLITSVPEPASILLLGAGVALPVFWAIRRRRSA
jgi:hypothetical protein